ncbi:storkhead-box protein 1-like [Dunckerocampus dactyliophorus]|uniref:storkhead-box protein 1-like n=1 Tax=Dunckerocampus dactyliophorus TaxID=161453 RepID=UPI0024060BE6|nr:storkhead-box protein 1-like [Dunckerocampus dactyliophorus]
MEKKGLAIAPHSLAVVLSRASGHDGEEESPLQQPPPSGYEVFADFKGTNMRQFWNHALTRALTEVFFLGWIAEHVLLIHGREVHLQVLRNGWTRRTLKPPPGFYIRCLVLPTAELETLTCGVTKVP